MIEDLAPGVKVVLPTGNVIVLVSREDDEWTCQYTQISHARGSVVFSETFLAKCPIWS